MRTALIDLDCLLYRIGFGAQRIEENLFGYEDFETELKVDPVPVVIDRLVSKINEVVKATRSDSYKLYMTDSKGLRQYLKENKIKLDLPKYVKNFRHSIAKTRKYKDRKQERPVRYYDLAVYSLRKLGAELAVGLEADDLLAMASTPDTVICSSDKDLKTVAGRFFNIDKVTTHKIGRIQALRFFYTQMLTGDPVDTIVGVEGVGEAKANKILEGCTSEKAMHHAVLGAYHGNRKKMLEQARLLHMIRELDNEGKPVMWRLYDERSN